MRPILMVLPIALIQPAAAQASDKGGEYDLAIECAAFEAVLAPLYGMGKRNDPAMEQALKERSHRWLDHARHLKVAGDLAVFDDWSAASDAWTDKFLHPKDKDANAAEVKAMIEQCAAAEKRLPDD